MGLVTRGVLISCAAILSSSTGLIGGGDRDPPELTVTTPERAARLESNEVAVGGRASDEGSGVESVTVNGVPAELADDGAFHAELSLEGGVSLIDVVVRDRAGNETRDVRAALSGRRSAESVFAGGLMARVSPEGYGLVAEAVRALLMERDLGAEASAGAVMSVPGCFEVDVVGLQHGAIGVELQPAAGGVDLEVEVRDVVVDLAVDVGGLCGIAGSSAPARLRTDALWLRGLARPAVSSGHVTIDLSGLAADLDSVDLDTSLVPSGVVDLLVDGAPSEIAGALGGAIGGLAGGLLGDSLGELDAAEWSTAVEGLDLTVRLTPTAMDAGTEGLAVTSSVELRFAGLGPVEYPVGAALAASPALDGGGPLRLAVADRVVNLLLSALWATGRLDHSVVVPEDHPARTRLGLDRLEIALGLPPMVTGREGSARVVIGDAVVTAYDRGGDAVMRMAVSAAADLALSAAGGGPLTPTPGATELWSAPLDDDGDSAATLEVPEPLRLAALDEVTRFLEESLGALPVPALNGIARISGLAAVPGFVVLDADLVTP